jgi:hypothetical protein
MIDTINRSSSTPVVLIVFNVLAGAASRFGIIDARQGSGHLHGSAFQPALTTACLQKTYFRESLAQRSVALFAFASVCSAFFGYYLAEKALHFLRWFWSWFDATDRSSSTLLAIKHCWNDRGVAVGGISPELDGRPRCRGRSPSTCVLRWQLLVRTSPAVRTQFE